MRGFANISANLAKVSSCLFWPAQYLILSQGCRLLKVSQFKNPGLSSNAANMQVGMFGDCHNMDKKHAGTNNKN